MKRETTILLLVTVALVLIGILMVYSACGPGTEAAQKLRVRDPWFYVRSQFLCACLGLAAMFAAMRFDYHHLAKPVVSRAIVLLTVALLLAVFIPRIGIEAGGARRWIQIRGFRFQPSELAKFAVILLLAVKLSQNQEQIGSFRRGFLPHVGIAMFFAVLILLENDLGMPVIIMSVGILMVLMAGARWVHVAASSAPFVLAVAVLVLTAEHRIPRIAAWLDPWADRNDTGFQLIQSLAAFAQGGVWGRGLGAGEQKLSYLPAAHTDFIFANWGEEMGLIGSLALVALFITFLVVAFRIALRAPDLFGTLLAAGIGGLVGLQAAVNMAVTLGLAPTKGLPLPFVSWGRSALIVFLGMVGILLNVGLQSRGPERPGG